MKICIIGHPRTRSSVLLESLCSQYEVPIIGEKINDLGKLAYCRARYDGVELSIPKFYRNLLNGCLTQIENSNNGVVRIHPTQLSFLLYSSKMIDFSRLDFSKYNKIYFTVRHNVSAMISSLFLAHTLGKFTYREKTEVHTAIQPIELVPNLYFNTIEMLLYSEFIMDEVKKYLTTNSIEWEELDYDIIPKHIEENYSNATSSHVETEYDYSRIVTNYDDLQLIYEQLKPIVYGRFCADNQVDK